LIELNGQRVDDIRAMKARLAEIIALGVQPPVIVDPSEQITMNTAVEVYDAARAAGVDRVLFAVSP
jgi:biopolymer transport protein ExbD